MQVLLEPGLMWRLGIIECMTCCCRLPLTVLHLSKSNQAWAKEEISGISSIGNGWYVTRTERLVHAQSQAQRFPSPAKDKFWLIDCSRAKLLNQRQDPSLHKTLGNRRCVFISRRLWHTFFEGSAVLPKAIFIGASLLYRPKQPLDHTIMGKEDKHAPPCCKTRLPSNNLGL